MREIKFRGKCLNSGNWVYGVPLESKFNCVYMLTKIGGLNADFINSRYTILDSRDSIPTDVNTIGQFTGLKDKNGVEIYEGDIVKDDRFAYKVEHNQQNTKFVINPLYKLSTKKYNIIDCINYDTLGNGYYSRKDLEVIGNIHEK